MSKQLHFINSVVQNAGTLFCVASNYSAHAKEMGGEVPSDPAIFIKPPQAIIYSGDTIKLPDTSANVHHEVELVVAIGKECRDISRKEAVNYISGYAVGIDVTMRDVQGKAKKEGKPWAIAKSFVTSAPISEIIPATDFKGVIPDFDLALKVNGETKQSDNTASMVRTVPILIEFLSRVFTLVPGDLIFTGTPSGVGRINKGDTITAELKDFVALNVNVE